jgi:hypothetical protein
MTAIATSPSTTVVLEFQVKKLGTEDKKKCALTINKTTCTYLSIMQEIEKQLGIPMKKQTIFAAELEDIISEEDGEPEILFKYAISWSLNDDGGIYLCDLLREHGHFAKESIPPLNEHFFSCNSFKLDFFP